MDMKYIIISDFGGEQTLLGYAPTLADAKKIGREACVCTAVVYRIADGNVCYTR